MNLLKRAAIILVSIAAGICLLILTGFLSDRWTMHRLKQSEAEGKATLELAEKAVNGAFANIKDNADSGQFIAIQKAAIAALDDQAAITPMISAKYTNEVKTTEPYAVTSALANVTKVVFHQTATGGNRGWAVAARTAGTEKWDTLYYKGIGKANGEDITIDVNRELLSYLDANPAMEYRIN